MQSVHPKVQQRPLGLRFVTLAMALFGGAGIGLLLAAWLAPGSLLALFFSFLLLPAALVVGFHIWVGFAVLLLVRHLIKRVARPSPTLAPRGHVIPPGAWSFIPVGSCLGLLGGALIGLLLSNGSAPNVTLAWWIVGTAYGGALWHLARAGYLPFPESD